MIFPLPSATVNETVFMECSFICTFIRPSDGLGETWNDSSPSMSGMAVTIQFSVVVADVTTGVEAQGALEVIFTYTCVPLVALFKT